GHTIAYGTRYLIPVDARFSKEADLLGMPKLDEVTTVLRQAKNLRMVVLNECQENRFEEELKRVVGSKAAANLGSDGWVGDHIRTITQQECTNTLRPVRNGAFTKAFLKHIETQEEIGVLMDRIRKEAGYPGGFSGTMFSYVLGLGPVPKTLDGLSEA